MAKLHLVMPMAGRGSRFFENGFVMPKPLIEINDRPFFYWATQSIAKFVDCADITFVVLEEHIRDHAIDREIKTYYPDAKIVALPEVTEGAAITALRGAESLPDDEPLLFNDCDHLFLCKPFNEFCKAGDFANGPDGPLPATPRPTATCNMGPTAGCATRWKSRSSAMMPSAGRITSKISSSMLPPVQSTCTTAIIKNFLFPAFTTCWRTAGRTCADLQLICTCPLAPRRSMPRRNRKPTRQHLKC